MRMLRTVFMRGAVSFGIAVLAAAAFSGTAMAAKGGKVTGGYGACSVTPEAVPVGGVYTITGSGFKSGQLLNVYVQDPLGTQAFMLLGDSAGGFSVSSYAAWSGASKVSVYDNGGRSLVYLTSCSFNVTQ